jgi:hypothetical protein
LPLDLDAAFAQAFYQEALPAPTTRTSIPLRKGAFMGNPL